MFRMVCNMQYLYLFGNSFGTTTKDTFKLDICDVITHITTCNLG